MCIPPAFSGGAKLSTFLIAFHVRLARGTIIDISRRPLSAEEHLMASATLQINVIPKRLLEKKEAAHHCGRSVRRFEIECPVQPIRFPNGDLRCCSLNRPETCM